jgi:hypothetical protein
MRLPLFPKEQVPASTPIPPARCGQGVFGLTPPNSRKETFHGAPIRKCYDRGPALRRLKFGLLSPRLFGYRHVRVPQVAQTIFAFVFSPSIVDCVCPRLFALVLLRSEPRRSGGGRARSVCVTPAPQVRSSECWKPIASLLPALPRRCCRFDREGDADRTGTLGHRSLR